MTSYPHTIVVDLSFGDAGKGTVVDWLCASRPVHAVVRFNGGAQAAHNVVTPDGRHHTFAQFSSGSFHRGVRTFLSRFMVVDPLALAVEADHLAALGVPDVWARLEVDGEALLATPYHRAANRARELARGGARHGSCGMGVGETVAFSLAHPADALRAADARSAHALRRKLTTVRDRLSDELGVLDAPPVEACVDAFLAFGEQVSIVDGTVTMRRLLAAGECVFEGAQGVLLDEWHGFHPYTTWSTTTFANAEELLAGAEATRLGVVRAYTTRHGAGPLVTEDPALTVDLPDAHNGTGPWQGTFRVGHFDAVAHRYAVDVCGGVDAIALTHLDVARRRGDLRACGSYEIDGAVVDRLTPGTPGDLDRQERLTRRLGRARPRYHAVPADQWPDAVAAALGAPVELLSYGPTAGDKASVRCERAQGKGFPLRT